MIGWPLRATSSAKTFADVRNGPIANARLLAAILGGKQNAMGRFRALGR